MVWLMSVLFVALLLMFVCHSCLNCCVACLFGLGLVCCGLALVV